MNKILGLSYLLSLFFTCASTKAVLRELYRIEYGKIVFNEKEGLYGCYICNRRLEATTPVEQHCGTDKHKNNKHRSLIMLKYIENYKHTCTLCSFLFESDDDLESHKKNDHGN